MIEVICADISQLTPEDYRRLYEQSTGERKVRADRYRFREDSLRCVAADALLRRALGGDSYREEKGPSGKPFIEGRADFHYNLTHSGNWVVIAFGDSEVGVDVQKLRADVNIEAVARRFFTPEERRYVFETKEKQLQRFYKVWTGKESYLKYLGTGLNRELTSFSVLSLEPEVRLHHRMIDREYSLCLCASCDTYSINMEDLKTNP